MEERLKSESDPRRRKNLETVLAHMKAEAASDLDGLMATLAPSPSYHAFGAPPEMSPQGTEAVSQLREFLLKKSIFDSISVIMACVGVIERDF